MLGISALAAVALAGVFYAGNQVSNNSVANLNAATTDKILFFSQTQNKMTLLNSFEKKTNLTSGGTTSGVYAYLTRDQSYEGETVTLDDTKNFVTVSSQSGTSYTVALRFKIFAKNIQEAQAYWTVTKTSTDSTTVAPTSTIAKARYSSDGSLNADALSGNGIDVSPSKNLTKSDLASDCNAIEFSFVITASESFVVNFNHFAVSWSC